MLKRMRRSVLLRAGMALALSTFMGACASSGGHGRNIPRPFPVPGNQSHHGRAPVEPSPRSRASTLDGDALVETALLLRGTPYRNGGADPKGFDCSGFTQYVFATHGVALPRAVRDQFQQG